MATGEVELLLKQWRSGDEAARDRLFARIYTELRLISAALLRKEARVSLSVGDLVNEASSRLIGIKNVDWQDKAHFMALSSRMMRRILIDHIRKKDSDKRYHHPVTLVTEWMGASAEKQDLQALEQVLIRLEAIDPKRAQIVEMRYFGGLSLEEIAVVLDTSPSTIKRNWRASRAWLLQALQQERDGFE
ncbi:MAG: ECF-type sigma factor [bacterium]